MHLLDLGNVLTPFFTDNGGTSLVSDTDPGHFMVRFGRCCENAS